MRRGVALWVSAMVVLAITGFAPASSRAAEHPHGPTSLPPPAHADRDGDGVDDALAHVLAEARPQDRLDVIVRVRRGTDVAGLHRRHGLASPPREFHLLDGFATSVTAAQARALAAAPEVVRIQADSTVHVALEDARADTGTDRARLGYDLDGSGVGVCVVDTGVDPGHEQLDGQGTIPFFDAINGQAIAYDDHGHGTHVAGIVLGDGTGGPQAAANAGVAPGASLYAAKVLSGQGSGSESQILAGMDWCASQPGVHVMSMSLGTTAGSDGQDALSSAVDAAVAEGLVVVVAAGNAGSNRQTVGAPGAAVGALTVGAAATWSGPTATSTPSWYGRPLLNGIYLSPFSSRGPTVATDGTAATRRTKPDVVAPGVHVVSAQAGTTTGYASYSGTSMATPFVSGTVALALQADPALTPDRVRYLVARTAHDRGWPGQDDDWGHGLLDGWAFVAAAAGDGGVATPTEFPGHHVVGSVASGASTWTHEFEVADLAVPVAVTMLIEGAYEEGCILIWCGIEVWTLPDLDARLVDPDGLVVDTSTCGLGCGNGTEGTQETLTAVPDKLGTWRLEVFPFDDGPGGTFVVDLSHGPVPGGDLNHPTDGRGEGREAAVHVAGMEASAVRLPGRWTATVEIVVVDADGSPAGPLEVTGHWDDGARASCVTVDGACTVAHQDLAMRDRSTAFVVDALRRTDGAGPVVWDRAADVTRTATVTRR